MRSCAPRHSVLEPERPNVAEAIVAPGRELRREQVVRPARDEPAGARLRRVGSTRQRPFRTLFPANSGRQPGSSGSPAEPRRAVQTSIPTLRCRFALRRTHARGDALKLGLGFGIARARRAEHLNAEPADLKDCQSSSFECRRAAMSRNALASSTCSAARCATCSGNASPDEQSRAVARLRSNRASSSTSSASAKCPKALVLFARQLRPHCRFPKGLDGSEVEVGRPRGGGGEPLRCVRDGGVRDGGKCDDGRGSSRRRPTASRGGCVPAPPPAPSPSSPRFVRDSGAESVKSPSREVGLERVRAQMSMASLPTRMSQWSWVQEGNRLISQERFAPNTCRTNSASGRLRTRAVH